MESKRQFTLRVGTRESKLALLQTEVVVEKLRHSFPDISYVIKPVTTGGDKDINRPIADLGARGVFVKELEEALLCNEVDLVIHSLKDLPTDLPAGLTLAAVLDREDPRDVLVSQNGVPFASLPPQAKIATSSRRRAAQLRSIRTDLVFVDIRGNIPTRLKKHDDGICDAMVLAAAGLHRLGFKNRIAEYLEPVISTPAAGQGALAVECRENDTSVLRLLNEIDDEKVRAEVTAERAFLDRLGGGCSVPIGALCITTDDKTIRLLGCVSALDGSTLIRHFLEGNPAKSQELGIRLADTMLAMGADSILDSLKSAAPSTVSPP